MEKSTTATKKARQPKSLNKKKVAKLSKDNQTISSTNSVRRKEPRELVILKRKRP